MPRVRSVQARQARVAPRVAAAQLVLEAALALQAVPRAAFEGLAVALAQVQAQVARAAPNTRTSQAITKPEVASAARVVHVSSQSLRVRNSADNDFETDATVCVARSDCDQIATCDHRPRSSPNGCQGVGRIPMGVEREPLDRMVRTRVRCTRSEVGVPTSTSRIFRAVPARLDNAHHVMGIEVSSRCRSARPGRRTAPRAICGLWVALIVAMLAACAAPRAAHPASAAITSRTRRVTELLVRREFAQLATMFDAPLRNELPVAHLDAMWSAELARAGEFREVRETWSFDSETGVVVVSLLRFERGVAMLRLRWNARSSIAGFVFSPGDVHARASALARHVLSGDSSEVYAHFSRAMRVAMTPQRFAQVVDAVRTQLGFARAIEDITVESERFDVATVQCRGDAAAIDLRLTFRKGAAELEGLYFVPPQLVTPPEGGLPRYAVAANYTEHELSVGERERALPATLTLPRAVAAVPGVVLVHGSGPHDRDETVRANRPFRDLALGLASRGIAVLRYEKRTYGANAATLRDAASITFDEETVDDAVAAVQLMLRTPGVDPTRVIVAGHSQGGMAAPRIAQREPRVFAIALLAAPARPLEVLWLEQSRYLATLSSGEPAQGYLDALQAQVARVKSPELANTRPELLPMGVPASFWLSLRGYAPVEVAKQVAKPTLVLQGDRDYQVTRADFDLWNAALGGESWATLRMLSGLNHLFETGEGRPSPADYERPSHVSEVAIDELARWILGLPARAGASGR